MNGTNRSDNPAQNHDAGGTATSTPDEPTTDVTIVGEAGQVNTDDADKEPRIPAKLPLLPLREHVAFPGTVMPLNVSREKSKHVLDLALASDHIIGVVAQRAREVEEPGLNDLYRIGTACHILKMFKLPDGTDTVIVHGLARIGIEDVTQETSYLEARVQHRYDKPLEADVEVQALIHNVRHAADRVLELSPNVPDEAKIVMDNITAPGSLADFLAANLPLSLVYKQELLETLDVKLRLKKVYAALTGQLEMLEISRKLHDDVRQRMDQSQRDYYLREQLKAIQAELGQTDAKTTELDALRKRIEAAKLPEPAALAAKRELERLASIPQASPDYSMALDYLHWVADLPWSVSTEDQLDLDRAQRILDEDHYGLEKIKRRILEYLAVRRLRPEGKGSILCFVGPPGVGKTSLGRSIARALDRKFIRMALGGVHDEAEIRGHRRTYIGALPGRILQNIKKCESNNPVFMLDEVDKLGQDFRGDPSSALLEVLDPHQNNTFNDHYLEVPFDLSNVFFIATANYVEAIPLALQDRMEIITLSSYTAREKLEIARQYLVPRQIEENGLTPKQIAFSDDAIRLLITGYTREAGVRELERRIGAMCRAQAARIVRKQPSPSQIGTNQVTKDLGTILFESEVASRVSHAGVVTALAYTPVGGDILFVEASCMPGRGSLSLTGQLGDVMRESAQAGFTIIRSNARRWKISIRQIAEQDLHVHVPAGATPKDGPSAGVAMLIAMLSVLRNKPVSPQTAMTGEITLRGAVLGVGGIKEKFLAAHRAGITRIIMPKANVKDLTDLPADVREDLEFVPVADIDHAVKAAFAKPRKKKQRKSATRPLAAKKKRKSGKTAAARKKKKATGRKRPVRSTKARSKPTGKKASPSRRRKRAAASRKR